MKNCNLIKESINKLKLKKNYFFSEYFNSTISECIDKNQYKTQDEFIVLKKKIRYKLIEALNLREIIENPVKTQIEDIQDLEYPEFKLQMIIYKASKYHFNTFFIGKPNDAAKTDKIILTFPGHHPHPGSNVLLGMEKYKSKRDLAAEFIKNGFHTAVTSLITIGEKLEKDKSSFRNKYNFIFEKFFKINLIRSCSRQIHQASLAGKSIAGLRLEEIYGMISILKNEFGYNDFCAAGFSSGGILSIYSAAVFDEITSCISSGAFSTFKKMFVENDSCGCSIIPGILQYCDFPDITASISPKKLFIQSGLNDFFTGISSADDENFRRVKKSYAIMNATDRLEINTHSKGHNYISESFIRWLTSYR